jgi:nucleotide-binding universal stress UspA family protein
MIEIKHILCPVDFSDCSRRAFDRAVAVARRYGSQITVLHVLPVASAVPAVPYGPFGPAPFGVETVDREGAMAKLPRFLAVEPSTDIPVRYEVAEAPSVHKEVLLQTARRSADLVVMGTHGRSGFDRLLLGSAAEKTLRTSLVPVLIVPPHTPDAVRAGRDPFERILHATDFSDASARALRYAASFAQHPGAQLTLVHVIEPLPVGYDPLVGVTFSDEAAADESAKTQLRQLVPTAVTAGCETATVVTRGKPYAEILRVATERRADLIVLGVHGRGALDRLVFGSTTEHIVRRATCPVLTVRDDEHPQG